MTKKKKDFPIKYLRKGLLTDEDFKDGTKKKLKRRIRKPKLSVHIKTGVGKNK